VSEVVDFAYFCLKALDIEKKNDIIIMYMFMHFQKGGNQNGRKKNWNKMRAGRIYRRKR
jgi:hypothetical protein